MQHVYPSSGLKTTPLVKQATGVFYFGRVARGEGLQHQAAKLLLTGSGGFIGKNLKEYLQDKYNLLTPRSYELNLIDENAVNEFNAIKRTKKQQLSDFILKQEGVYVNPDFIFDVQVKRLHEYKRQLMNAFSIVAIYQKLKAGELPDWNPTAFISLSYSAEIE